MPKNFVKKFSKALGILQIIFLPLALILSHKLLGSYMISKT
jgi:hypothetical protein